MYKQTQCDIAPTTIDTDHPFLATPSFVVDQAPLEDDDDDNGICHFVCCLFIV